MTSDQDGSVEIDSEGVLYEEQVQPEYGILGFTLRELLIVGVWALAFIISFFPLFHVGSVWTVGLHWLLPIGVPTAAVFLIVLRRFSPEGIRRVGSLGIDQFASVAFSVAAVTWAQILWDQTAASVSSGQFLVTWVPIVQFVLTLALVALTVFAPIIPVVCEDFRGRLETLAHRSANPVRPVIARPRPIAAPAEEPETAQAASDADETTVLDVELSGDGSTDEIDRLDLASRIPLVSHASGGDTGTAADTDDDYVPGYRRSRLDEAEDRDAAEDAGTDSTHVETQDEADASYAQADDAASSEGFAQEPDEEQDIDQTNPRNVAPVTQPFWILAPSERDVHDERGDVLFRIGPDAWALVIEDRGGAYVVRHDDGRVGYLHDISDVARG